MRAFPSATFQQTFGRAHQSPAQSFWEALAQVRQRDALSDRVHFALALLYVALIPLATAPAGIASGLLLGCAILRLRQTYRLYYLLTRDWLVWLFLGWGVWHAASILWSADPHQGLHELRAYRMAISPLLLVPVLDRMNWLVGAFLVGVAGQNLVQLAQWVGWYPKKPGDGERIRGLIHPIQTGTMCTAAMCWHLSAALRAPARVRWLSIAGFMLAGLGLVLTGSRGPWISAAAALSVGVVIFAWTGPVQRRQVFQFILLAAAAALIIGTLSKDVITKRINETLREIPRVMEGKYRGDIGDRIASWAVGWEMFIDAPIHGVGAGGFHDAVKEHTSNKRLKNAYHAHSMYVHVLACTGIVGGLIVAGLLLISIVRIWQHPPVGIYADGFLLVLLSWLIAAMFDAYQASGLPFGLFAFLMAASLMIWRRPAPPIGSEA